jgi:8-oxo-dGTP diphosphatase
MAPKRFKYPKGLIAHEWPPDGHPESGVTRMNTQNNAQRSPYTNESYDDYYLERPRNEDPKENQYVVGLMFTEDKSRVLLLKKTHPAWQAGKMNGTGGKLVDGELVRGCVVREHREEVGVDTIPEQWGHFLTLQGSDWRVYYFVTFDDAVLNHRDVSDTDETPVLMRVSSVGNVTWTALATMGTELIYNMKWIIPMSLDETIQHPVVIGDNVP